jgi:hypothetical protein
MRSSEARRTFFGHLGTSVQELIFGIGRSVERTAGGRRGKTRQDQHDEWQDGRRHFSQQSMARVMHPNGPPLLTNPLTEGLVA